MWAVRVITGPRAGHILNLKTGRNVIGRGADCDLIINSGGVSKHHCEINIIGDKITVSDLKSSNGTILNGVRIQSGFLHLGDKISVGDVLLDIISAPRESSPISTNSNVALETENPSELVATTRVISQHHQQNPMGPAGNFPQGSNAPRARTPSAKSSSKGSSKNRPPSSGPSPRANYHYNDLESKLMEYINRVVLPMVYDLFQMFEFRQIILGFSLVLIVGTTLLSVLPMVHLTQEGVMTESRRRAQSLARSLGSLNQNAILQDSMANLSVGTAENEDGVKTALIVRQSDGMILAPSTRAGVVSDIAFVHTARQEMRPFIKDIDSGTIGASFPIGGFDSNSGEQVVKAHAIILYDVSSIAMDDSRFISLFMQTLVLALILGVIVFFLMYKVVEYPLSQLNLELDSAMRDKTDNIVIKVINRPLQNLISNINSLLTRSMQMEEQVNPAMSGVNKHIEAENLVKIIGYPCLVISDEGIVMAGNGPFEQIAKMPLVQLQGHKFTAIPDSALQKNLSELIDRTRSQPAEIHNDQLTFSGHNFKISCYGMGAISNKFDYFVISVSPLEESSE